MLVLTFRQWVLIELARNPQVQKKLREELSQFSNSDPTWDQLVSGLPYLDAVAQESIRLHPPVEDVLRVVRTISSRRQKDQLPNKFFFLGKGRRHHSVGHPN